MVDESKVSRLDSLTGARFIAAASVFIFHAASIRIFQPTGPDSDFFLTISATSGTMAVSFFFVLSGFILTWSARKYDTAREFYRRRFFKIFPNHIVTFLLSLVVYATLAGALLPALLNITLLHAWVPKMPYFISFNHVTWSLSCELLFYAAFPLLYKLAQRIPVRRLWWAAGAVLAAIFVVPLFAKLLPTEPRMMLLLTDNQSFSEPILQYWFVYIFPPVRLLDFVLGILMARIVLSGRWINLRPLPALAVVVACYVLASFVPFLYSLNAVTIVGVALIIPAVASAETAGRPTFLASRPMIWLGEISFAFYMVHMMVILYGRQQVGYRHFLNTTQGIGWILLMFAITLVGGWLLYVAVERPMMRRFARARRKRPAVETTVS